MKRTETIFLRVLFLGGFIALLGYLIERISGQDYYTYVRENLFSPAGMINTDCYDVEYPIPTLAIGYTKSGAKPGSYRKNEYMKMTKGSPAGGGYSTVEDLLHFSNALINNELLNEEYTRLATTDKVEVDDVYEGGMYCYGFLEQNINGHRIFGHSSYLSGIRSTLNIYPEIGYTVAILSNFDRGMGAEEL
jgi:D-alanyl-D-alanine carboxypeptidase